MSRIHVGIALAMLLGAFALVASAGNSGAAEMQQVEPFTSVKFSLPGELTLVQTDEPVVSIEATPAQLEDIVIKVRDGQLIIRASRDRGWGPKLDSVKVQAGYQSLEGVSVAGSGNILADAIRAKAFSMAVGGSGEILMQALECKTAAITVAGSGDVSVSRLSADAVTTKISGSGDINLAGEAGEQTLKIAGSGDYMAEELQSAVAELSIAGSGTARLNVRERISGSVAGSGDLFYRGEPDVAVRIAGSGSIRQMDGAL